MFALGTDAFLTEVNLLNLLRQSAPLLIVAVAMTFVITTGGIDLSVGSTVALVNALAAIALQAGLPWPVTVVLMLALGAAVGAVQGWFVAYPAHPGLHRHAGRAVHPARRRASAHPRLLDPDRTRRAGSCSSAAAGSSASRCRRRWRSWSRWPAWITLTQTRFGRYVTGVGANAEAARRAGIAVNRVTLGVYVLTGIAAAAAGIIIAGRLGSGSSNAAVGFELEVIAAVVLGGTALTGGRGTIIGTVLGALTIAVIGNGLILAHISPFFTQIVTGADHPRWRSG